MKREKNIHRKSVPFEAKSLQYLVEGRLPLDVGRTLLTRLSGLL